ncbi:hypothetical protein BCON_0021g00550 [Botryotinia convoluta]|uniref:Uncharacterized protein n=1 Tax=Botryotinia convoluta TaxID=54673 RepID=A0A4Z1IRW8_9HELO|nr:hypothetical protein BCON_0021g00550 [Botryotinia convoluta]
MGGGLGRVDVVDVVDGWVGRVGNLVHMSKREIEKLKERGGRDLCLVDLDQTEKYLGVRGKALAPWFFLV